MRVKASYRLLPQTVQKLKQISAARKKSDKDPSQGKIIDELVTQAGSEGRTIKLTKATERQLKRLARQHGLPAEKIVDLLINTAEFELNVKHTSLRV